MIPFAEAEAWRILHRYASMEHINTGGCENFAQAMLKHIPNGELTYTDNFICWDHSETWCGGHCWIFDGEKHYDSEALTGVDDWKKLPFFVKRMEGILEKSCCCQQTCTYKSPS